MNISFVYRKFQKSVAGFAILALLTSFVSFVGVAQASDVFPDVADDHWAHDYINDLVDQAVVDGYEDGTFGPDDTVTRAQLAKVAVLAFLGEDELDESYDAGFTDVPDGEWFTVYVNTAAKNGIVTGYTDADGDPTGEFGPNNSVNRAEAAAIFTRAAGFTTDTTGGPHFTDVSVGEWFYDDVETVYNNGVVSGYGDGTYGPGDIVTRAQMAKIAVLAQNPVAPADDDDDDDVVGSGDGTLSVDTLSLSGGTVPKSATAVPMLGLELTANGDDMTLDSLIVDREGVGSVSDFDNLYFFNGDTRVGSGHSISSDTNQATFNGLSVDVMDGDTVWVWIKADYSSSATGSNQNYLQISDEDNMGVSGGDVSGSFPLMGPTFTIGGATAGTITIEKNSTVANPTIGETDAEIANFELEATNEDMSIESLALTLKGSISADGATGFTLLQAGEVLATTDDVSSEDLFTFVLDTPYEIEKGDSRVFSVTAEITSKADDGDTVKVYLDENTDLVAVGDVYGFGASVASSLYDNSVPGGTTSSDSIVEGGTFTVAFNGPPVFDFAPNSKNLSFLDLTFTSGRDVEVRQLDFTIAATGSGLVDDDDVTANFTDIKLVNSDTGGTLMGPKELATSGAGFDVSQDLSFTDSWYLDAGESVNGELQMDVANESTLDDTPTVVTVTMKLISTTEGVKDTGTGEYLTDIVPSGAIAGYSHTAQDSSLSVAIATSPPSDTIVKGSQDELLIGLVFKAGNSSDITITRIDPTVAFSLEDAGADGTWSVSGSTGSTTYARELVQTLRLYDDDGVELGEEAVPTNGAPTFDSLSVVVPAGGTTTVWVHGDIATTAPAEGSSDLIGIDIEATGDVVAEDEDANSVTLTAANPNGATAANATTVAMTVTAGGTIAVTAPSSQEDDKLVAAGSSDVFVGMIDVKATDEDFKITDIRLDLTTSNSAIAELTIKYPTDLDNPTTLDGSSSQTWSGTAVTFSGLDFMVEADNDNVFFEIYADVNGHSDDSGNADTGDSLQISLFPYAASFEANGMGSGITKTGVDAIASTVSTNKPYVFKSVPSVTVGTPSSGTTLIETAQSEVMRFTVSADSNGDLALLALRFDISASGITTGSTGLGGAAIEGMVRGSGTAGRWEMFEISGGSIDTNADVGSGEFVIDGFGTNLDGDTVYMDVYDDVSNWNAGTGSFEEITAGSSMTYGVTTTIADDGIDDGKTPTISVRIGSDSSASFAQDARPETGVPLTGTLASSAFVWSDRPNATSFGTGDTGTLFWNNGYEVDGLPTGYTSQSK